MPRVTSNLQIPGSGRSLLIWGSKVKGFTGVSTVEYNDIFDD